MTEPQLDAYCLLAESIAHYAYRKAHDDADFRGAETFSHDFESSGEEVADDLLRLKIIEGDPSGFDSHTFCCAMEDVVAVAHRNHCLGRSFDALLRTFIMVYYQWGTEYWGFKVPPDEAFSVHPKMRRLMQALVQTGDVMAIGEMHQWSPRVMPLVREHGYCVYWPCTVDPASALPEYECGSCPLVGRHSAATKL